jgi:hypothetical protein
MNKLLIIRNYVLFFACILVTIKCASKKEIVATSTDLESPKYKLEQDGQSFSVKCDKVKIRFMNHTNDEAIVEANDEFNRGIKRNPAILITGDKPRFALMRTYPVAKSDPDLIKLGDCRVYIENGGVSKWLDEMSDITTVFHPGNTTYSIKDSLFTGVEFQFVVSQAENWGAVGQLTIANRQNANRVVNVKLVYGGLRHCGRTNRAAYFTADENDGKNDEIQIENDHAFIIDKNEDIHDIVSVSFKPKQLLTIENQKVTAKFRLNIKANNSETLFIQAGFANTKETISGKIYQNTTESLIAESKTYYERLIAPYKISTPSSILDAGFRTSIYSMNYVYADSAWLEGVHWWSCYWTNLFQISAAISINQLKEARKALQFFNNPVYGPMPPLLADGSSFKGTAPSEEGLLYYIYELHQYFEHTGDTALLKEVWSGILKAINAMQKYRDPDGNALLNWHMGCNSFLYQADMLQLPGHATSPSLIYAGSLGLASKLAKIVGDENRMVEYEKTAQRSLLNAQQKLWNRNDGCFFSHIDLQNIQHICHYYTDMVFPVLYTSSSDLVKWQGLEFLKNTLFLESKIVNPDMNFPLMRVGDLKSTLFGNDNVMPTQMTEAARAFFAMGQYETGYRLAEAVALASTIYTEAPGNFPELMNFEGKGEANYNFGNPIGSFLYSVTRGLFGLSITEAGKKLDWTPAFPADWEHAEITLPYAIVHYKKHKTKLSYVVEHSTQRDLTFSIFLNPCTISKVEVNGENVDFQVSDGIGKMRLELSAPAGSKHQITITYKPISLTLEGPAVVQQNGIVKWTFSVPIERIMDPQGVLTNVQISKKYFTAQIVKPNSFLSRHQVFAKLKGFPIIYPIDLDILPEYSIACDTAYYDAQNKQLNFKVSCLVPDNKSKIKLYAEILGHKTEIELSSSGVDKRYQHVALENIDMPPEGCYQASFKLKQKDVILFENSRNIILIGSDSLVQKTMEKLRDEQTRYIDISPHLNTNKIIGMTRWRNGREIIIEKSRFSVDTNHLATPVGIFNVSPNQNFIAMVEYGISEPFSSETLPVPYPKSIVLDIQKKTSMISALFVNESQCRNTWAQVGSIVLNYDDDQQKTVPLIMGDNVESFDKSFIKNTYAVMYANGRDHLNILRIPCDSKRVLKSISIQIDAADFQFGLIGLNYVTIKK